MELEVQSAVQARAAVRRSLGLGDACQTADARFELLRTAVWSLSLDGNSVHIARVLSAALPAWRLLRDRKDASEDGLRADLKQALASLLDAGDLIEMAGGRWTAAATRLVGHERNVEKLLVGGAPLSVLPVAPGDVRHHGPYRHVSPSERLSAALPKEALSNWARLPDTPLREWAEELRGSLERLPYARLTNESFEFYLPGRARARAPQFRRWCDEPGDAGATLLARRTRLYGAREYRLVDVSDGRIIRACEFPASEARRLMYALDSEARNPVQARCLILAQGRRDVLLTSELPRPEQRVLAALGTLEIPVDRPFERRWSFEQGQDLALNLMRALGIEVVESREVRR